MSIEFAWKHAENDTVLVTLSISDGTGADGKVFVLEAGQKLRASWLDQGDARNTAVDIECVDPASEQPLVFGFHGSVTLGELESGRLAVVSTSGWLEVGRLDVSAVLSAHSTALWRTEPGAGLRFPVVLRTPWYARQVSRLCMPAEGPHKATVLDRLPIAIEPPRSAEIEAFKVVNGQVR